MEAKNTPQENKIEAEESKITEVKPPTTPATTDAAVADVDADAKAETEPIEATTTNKESKEEGEVGNEKEENSKQQFNNKGLEVTAKTLNKTNFSRSQELADKYANQLIDSAERFGKKISIDKIKEKLGEDLFRNLKQTSLKYFFDFLLFQLFSHRVL